MVQRAPAFLGSKQKKERVKQSMKQVAADSTRKATAQVSLWLSASLLFAASLAAVEVAGFETAPGTIAY
jgi:hypothetical protein